MTSALYVGNSMEIHTLAKQCGSVIVNFVLNILTKNVLGDTKTSVSHRIISIFLLMRRKGYSLICEIRVKMNYMKQLTWDVNKITISI